MPALTKPFEDRPLLILDLDGTLIYAVEHPLEISSDFSVGDFSVYERPYLREFLTECAVIFNLAIWSSGSFEYVNAIVDQIFSETVKPVFVWSRERCSERREPETDEIFFQKDLKKVKRHGYLMPRIIIVEDDRRNVQAHYGNAVFVKSFQGNSEDDELRKLVPFLRKLATLLDVRSAEKRTWRIQS